ncbi:uncharacterized protein TRUGW13939_06614 [Talaromyces rugulosus]|uniref:Acyltransferase 3 domain-containing protein n=1 Tax=Talaromyces rugulosus TaxID=121627 RepID=A0A7H8QZF9_TALRU|nr:uncharacterized protein TRUGW13939_06614 [Talaromyces rugulosus]QKX59480.1 hypothetical protein TRUGW13939_06614 [Talaromyces rugulosus]
MSKRRHDLDNLRTFLTALVIYHHTAITYGGLGSWFKSRNFGGHTSMALALFNATNQTFFMGLFFWLSGYLSGNRLSKSPTWDSRYSFLSGKWFHLGLPAVIYTVFVQPLSQLLVLFDSSGFRLRSETILSTFVSYWKQLRGVRGPLWYPATLLGFDMISTFCIPRTISPRAVRRLKRFVSNRLAVSSLWISSTALTFGIRTVYPVGATVPVFAVQPAFLPQYILSYALGIISSLTDTPRLVTPFSSEKSEETADTVDTADTPSSHPIIPYTHSALSFPLITAPIMINRYSPAVGGNPSAAQNLSPRLDLLNLIGGGLTLPSFLYTAWSELSFAAIGPSLLQYFSRAHNHPAKRGSLFHPRYSYAAFLVHTPVAVLSGLVADRILDGVILRAAAGGQQQLANNKLWRILAPVLMTAVVGTGNVLGSFALGRFIVDYVPGVGKVI